MIEKSKKRAAQEVSKDPLRGHIPEDKTVCPKDRRVCLLTSDVDNQKDVKNGLRTFGMNGQGRRLPFANIKDLKK